MSVPRNSIYSKDILNHFSVMWMRKFRTHKCAHQLLGKHITQLIVLLPAKNCKVVNRGRITMQVLHLIPLQYLFQLSRNILITCIQIQCKGISDHIIVHIIFDITSPTESKFKIRNFEAKFFPDGMHMCPLMPH